VSAFSGPQKRGARRERKAEKRMEAEERQGKRRPRNYEPPEIPLYPLEDESAEKE
jgi:hypothetical protein